MHHLYALGNSAAVTPPTEPPWWRDTILTPATNWATEISSPIGPHQESGALSLTAEGFGEFYFGSMTCNPLTREKCRLLKVATWLPRSRAVAATINS